MSNRQWQMWAGWWPVRDDGHEYRYLADHRRYPESYGAPEVHRVLAVEDPEGTYYGWLDFTRIEAGKGVVDVPEAEQAPALVWSRYSLFSMQFPYGVDAEVAANKGRVVRLTVTRTPNEETP